LYSFAKTSENFRVNQNYLSHAEFLKNQINAKKILKMKERKMNLNTSKLNNFV